MHTKIFFLGGGFLQSFVPPPPNPQTNILDTPLINFYLPAVFGAWTVFKLGTKNKFGNETASDLLHSGGSQINM